MSKEESDPPLTIPEEETIGTGHANSGEGQQTDYSITESVRRNLSNGLDDARRNLKEGAESARKSIKSGYETARRNIKAGMDTARMNIASGLETARRNINESLITAQDDISPKSGTTIQNPASSTTVERRDEKTILEMPESVSSVTTERPTNYSTSEAASRLEERIRRRGLLD